MKERIIISVVAMLFIASIVIGVIFAVQAPEGPGGQEWGFPGYGPAGYGVVYLYGEIRSGAEPPVIGESGTEDVAAQLRELGNNPRVKAIVLRINSPGGAVAATQEVYAEILRLKKKGMPIIASIGDLGASGAYYISCGTSKIMADPASTVGSVGVIAMFPNVQDLLNNKLGVHINTITSGKWKDAGSPFREMTPEERQRFEAMIQDVYAQFFDVVKEARLDDIKASISKQADGEALTPEELDNQALDKLKEMTQGQVFIGKNAYELGLIDGIGNFYDAIEEAKRMGNLPDDAPRIEAARPLQRLLGSLTAESKSPAVEAANRLTATRLEYLYVSNGLLD